MTTPNDAPRPTSELTKEMIETAQQLPWASLCAPGVGTLLLEAAASLQSLEARNKELEGALELIASGCREIEPDVFAAEAPVWAKDPFNNNATCQCGYCGAWESVVRPGKTQCDWCSDGRDKPAIARAALHPATKTGET